jgi:hypothetical protein
MEFHAQLELSRSPITFYVANIDLSSIQIEFPCWIVSSPSDLADERREREMKRKSDGTVRIALTIDGKKKKLGTRLLTGGRWMTSTWMETRMGTQRGHREVIATTWMETRMGTQRGHREAVASQINHCIFA